MRNMKKVVLLVLIGMFFLTGCGKTTDDEDGHIDVDPDSAILSEKTIEGLKISDLSIVYDNNVSRLVANVKNTNASDYTLRVISIKLYDADDDLLIDTTGYIGTVIKVNETKQLIVEVTKDLKDAKKVEYKILK